MRIKVVLALMASIELFGGAQVATASPPLQSAEDAAEQAWETYVASSTPNAIPGTLSCAVSDSDGRPVATCFALAAAEDGSVASAASVIVARSTSTDGATWAEFEPVPVAPPSEVDAIENASSGGFAMPEAVGIDLQQAQDLLQEVSGEVLYVSLSEDATGQRTHAVD